MENKYSRREFLRRTGIAGVSACGLLLAGDDLLSILNEVEAAKQPILSIASKGSPEQLVKKAVDGLGGIGKFVKKGSKVLIKPNLAWIRTPETAANTNPQVLAAIIKLCKSALPVQLQYSTIHAIMDRLHLKLVAQKSYLRPRCNTNIWSQSKPIQENQHSKRQSFEIRRVRKTHTGCRLLHQCAHRKGSQWCWDHS